MNDTLCFTLAVGDGGWLTNKPHPTYVTGTLHFRLCDQLGDPYIHARFYFDPDTWNTSEHGLIYGDTVFLEDLHDRLNARGWQHANTIMYSEAGMQEPGFVDFDCGSDIWTDLLVNAVGAPINWCAPEMLCN